MNVNNNDEYTMQTLLDYLAYDMRLLSIGCNPSPLSIKHQCYFANPRNRFWKALNGSGLVEQELKPEMASMQILLNRYRIGFTDVVKRCTPGVSDLKAEDYRHASPQLLEKINEYQPDICWFHGKVAYKNFLKYTSGIKEDVDWGMQKPKIGKSKIFVTPNPSPANAVYSVDALIDWYARLKKTI